MTRMTRAERVLKVLILIHQQPRKSAELAALLGVSARTILRDVKTLRAAGIDVKTSTTAAGGIWLYKCDIFKERGA